MKDFEAFVEWLEGQDHSPATIRNYYSDLVAFERWFEKKNRAHLQPGGLTPGEIRAYRQYLLNVRRLKAATINRALSALSAYARYGQGAGYLDHNPTSKVRGIDLQPCAPHWLDKKQQAALQRELDLRLSTAYSAVARMRMQRDQTIVLLLMHTGLRLGELCGLHTSDITLEAWRGLLRVQAGKGSKQRQVPLNWEARNLLQAWLIVRSKWIQRNAMGHAWLFIAQSGEPLAARTIQKMLGQISDRLEFHLSPHMLRHTFAKNLIDAGVTLEKVAALLGHSSMNTTRLYLTPGEQDLARAVEALV